MNVPFFSASPSGLFCLDEHRLGTPQEGIVEGPEVWEGRRKKAWETCSLGVRAGTQSPGKGEEGPCRAEWLWEGIHCLEPAGICKRGTEDEWSLARKEKGWPI